MNTPENKKKFQTALQSHRKRLGLTQSEAAKNLSMPKRTWEDYEHGKRTPPPWVQALILQFLENAIPENVKQKIQKKF